MISEKCVPVAARSGRSEVRRSSYSENSPRPQAPRTAACWVRGGPIQCDFGDEKFDWRQRLRSEGDDSLDARSVSQDDDGAKIIRASRGISMWRVIVRISFFHDQGSRLRNHLAPMFTSMGLQNTHTGTWESPAVDFAQAATQMTLVFQALADPQRVPGVDRQAALNHLWVYIDRV